MILEAVIALLLTFTGTTVVYGLGIRGWSLLPLGFITGASLYIVFGAILLLLGVVVGLSLSPLATLGSLFTAATLYWAWRFMKRSMPTKRELVIAICSGIAIFCFVVLLYVALSPFTYIKHVDSIEYLAIGSMISTGTYYEGVQLYQLQKRLLAVPFLHSPAALTGGYYLTTLMPLLALSGLGVLAWALREGLAKLIRQRGVMLTFVVLGVLLLATNNRFIMHAMYINGHLFFGILLCLLVASGWLLATKKEAPRQALMAFQLLAIPVLILSRAEAPLILGVALLPVILSMQLSLWYRRLLVTVLGVSIVIWQTYIIGLHVLNEVAVPLSAFGFWVLGMGILAAAPLLKVKFLHNNRRMLLWVAEIGLWAVLLAFALRDPAVLAKILDSIQHNSVYGEHNMWGASFVILLLLLGVVFTFLKFKNQALLRFPVTAFFPLVMLLPYIIGSSGYRVGGGDSLNRMWMQIIPLAVFYIMIAIAVGRWRFRNMREHHEK